MNVPAYVPVWLILNLYSAVLLLFIFFSTLRSLNAHTQQQKTFLRVLIFTLFLLCADSVGRINHASSDLYSAVLLSDAALFLGIPYELLLCLKYVGSQLNVNRQHIRRCMIPQFCFAVANTLLVILSFFNGGVYYFDANRIYHRGPLFLVCVVFSTLIIGLYEIFIINNRKQIEHKHIFAYVFFPVPPVICGAFQVAFPPLALGLSGITFSLLVIFIYIQNRNMDIDYLTGAYNRRKLDFYLQEKIRTATPGRTFSAIMLDLDHFKEINDTCGHGAGDAALEGAVKLLKQCFRSDDFVARYGGDEFCVVLNISERKDLEAAVTHLKRKLQEYNAQNRRPLSIGFSIGYSVYNVDSGMSAKQFQEEIDRLMYEDKIIKRRAARQPVSEEDWDSGD